MWEVTDCWHFSVNSFQGDIKSYVDLARLPPSLPWLAAYTTERALAGAFLPSSGRFHLSLWAPRDGPSLYFVVIGYSIAGSKHPSWVSLLYCFIPSAFLASKGRKCPDIIAWGKREAVTPWHINIHYKEESAIN